jgi:hypothetical protein
MKPGNQRDLGQRAQSKSVCVQQGANSYRQKDGLIDERRNIKYSLLLSVRRSFFVGKTTARKEESI